MVAVAKQASFTQKTWSGSASDAAMSADPARTGNWVRWVQFPATHGGMYPAIGELVINGRKCSVAEHIDEGGMRYVCLVSGHREWIVSQDADGEWFSTNDDDERTMAWAIEAAYRHLDQLLNPTNK